MLHFFFFHFSCTFSLHSLFDDICIAFLVILLCRASLDTMLKNLPKIVQFTLNAFLFWLYLPASTQYMYVYLYIAKQYTNIHNVTMVNLNIIVYARVEFTQLSLCILWNCRWIYFFRLQNVLWEQKNIENWHAALLFFFILCLPFKKKYCSLLHPSSVLWLLFLVNYSNTFDKWERKKNNNEDREKKTFVNDFLNVFAVLQFSDVFSYNFFEYKYHLNDADCEIYL